MTTGAVTLLVVAVLVAFLLGVLIGRRTRRPGRVRRTPSSRGSGRHRGR